MAHNGISRQLLYNVTTPWPLGEGEGKQALTVDFYRGVVAMLRRSSDQERAIWAGLQIASLVRQGHTPDTSQGWKRVDRFKRLHTHYVVLSHSDQTVAEKTQQAIEVAVGATVIDCLCKEPNYIHVPKP